MSGKPAARVGDMTMYGGPIVQGSSGVMIGAPTGVACSVCPGGVTSGSPVNPLLGAKVLPGETDLALPCALPFALTRTYSSYRTRTPAPVGLLGPGWKTPADIRLQLRGDTLILNDSGGRSIFFDPLLPGETAFSRSETFWLARSGTGSLHESNPLYALWLTLPETLRLSPHLYLATDSVQGPWWLLGWSERIPAEDEPLPAPLPPYRVLTGLADSAGRMLRFHRDIQGEFAGCVTAVTDGAGRRFTLALSTQPQRAKCAAAPLWPDTVPVSRYGDDSGIRLDAVWLAHDPEYPDALPASPLVRYTWTAAGELEAVYDRGGGQVRSFAYDPSHPGRMVAHSHAGRPPVTYRYDAAGRVTEQNNPAGLSYRYDYERHRVVIADSLNRRETLHTDGEGGLKRVVRKEHADGSVTHSEYNAMGWLTAQTDAAGRTTQYRHSIASGDVTGVITPDGRETTFNYNHRRQLTAVVHPDGREARLAYDDAGRLVAETSPGGITTRYSYDAPYGDLPSAIEDAAGSRTQITRNRYGQVLTVTDCSGYLTRYEYNRAGQVLAVHREEGLSRYFAYDDRGRLTCQTGAQGEETRYEYSPAGDLTAVILPDGSRSDMRHDPAGRLISVSQGGLTRRLEYDSAGRLLRLVSENGDTATFTRDVMDRVTTERGFDGRTLHRHYDRAGRLTRSVDGALVTQWHYDEADRLSHRTVNGEEAERWLYDDRGWLSEISHLSEGHRVAVQYRYDRAGRLISERQTVHQPQTGSLLWQHEMQHDHNGQGLANRLIPDSLPAVAWLTYGSGHLAGMKLGDMPLIEFTRDRLHRETLRRFGSDAADITTLYTADGHVRQQRFSEPLLNREYDYNAAGQLTGIRTPGQETRYGYDGSGRLAQVRTLAENGRVDFTVPYFTDPAGNRLADPSLCPQRPSCWPGNRVARDARYQYQHDEHGRLIRQEVYLPPDAGMTGSELIRHYHYDTQHRLVHYRCEQVWSGNVTAESRYMYDPLGRRVGKQVWKSRRYGEDYSENIVLNPVPELMWYGWDGDRLVTMQTAQSRIQTVYEPGSFTPLLRVETRTAELDALHRHRTLAEKLQQEGSADGSPLVFPPALVRVLDRLEQELRADAVSEESQQWLAGCGLTPAQMAAQMEPLPVPERKIHLFHCDHRGLPLALTDMNGSTDWHAEYDAWGNLLRESNPHNLTQLIRLPGQQYDEESGLYYNRHRYYDPLQGRYITQDPIGLRGGWNVYAYPLDPIDYADPLGLKIFSTGMSSICAAAGSAMLYLEPQEAQTVISNITSTEGAWTDGHKYIQGWAIDTPIVSLTTLSGVGGSLALIRSGMLSFAKIGSGSASTCAAVEIPKYMTENQHINTSELTDCALTGAMGAGKGALEKAVMKMGYSFLRQGMDVGAGMDAAVNTGIEEAIGGALGKLPIVPDNPFGDFITDTIASGANKSDKNNSKDNENE